MLKESVWSYPTIISILTLTVDTQEFMSKVPVTSKNDLTENDIELLIYARKDRKLLLQNCNYKRRTET